MNAKSRMAAAAKLLETKTGDEKPKKARRGKVNDDMVGPHGSKIGSQPPKATQYSDKKLKDREKNAMTGPWATAMGTSATLSIKKPLNISKNNQHLQQKEPVAENSSILLPQNIEKDKPRHKNTKEEPSDPRSNKPIGGQLGNSKWATVKEPSPSGSMSTTVTSVTPDKVALPSLNNVKTRWVSLRRNGITRKVIYRLFHEKSPSCFFLQCKEENEVTAINDQISDVTTAQVDPAYPTEVLYCAGLEETQPVWSFCFNQPNEATAFVELLLPGVEGGRNLIKKSRSQTLSTPIGDYGESLGSPFNLKAPKDLVSSKDSKISASSVVSAIDVEPTLLNFEEELEVAIPTTRSSLMDLAPLSEDIVEQVFEKMNQDDSLLDHLLSIADDVHRDSAEDDFFNSPDVLEAIEWLTYKFYSNSEVFSLLTVEEQDVRVKQIAPQLLELTLSRRKTKTKEGTYDLERLLDLRHTAVEDQKLLFIPIKQVDVVGKSKVQHDALESDNLNLSNTVEVLPAEPVPQISTEVLHENSAFEGNEKPVAGQAPHSSGSIDPGVDNSCLEMEKWTVNSTKARVMFEEDADRKTACEESATYDIVETPYLCQAEADANIEGVSSNGLSSRPTDVSQQSKSPSNRSFEQPLYSTEAVLTPDQKLEIGRASLAKSIFADVATEFTSTTKPSPKSKHLAPSTPRAHGPFLKENVNNFHSRLPQWPVGTLLFQNPDGSVTPVTEPLVPTGMSMLHVPTYPPQYISSPLSATQSISLLPFQNYNTQASEIYGKP